MRLFGLEITRARSGGEKALVPVSGGDRGWWPLIRESYTGAWQHGVVVDHTTVLSNHADFACRTLISSDIGKLGIKLVARGSGGIWSETRNPAYSPVLRRPNRYQTRQQFIETWVLSKLQRGNTYVLKERDGSNKVRALYILDPNRVKTLVSDDGGVYYDLSVDELVGVGERVVVPASEIIHDRFNCFFHPLVGLSPIYAGGLAATQGLAIQDSATKFFQNRSQPGGILTAPGHIADETAARLKETWTTNFTGENAGKVAVLGDGLHFEPMATKATDAQLIEQLKWTAEQVCSTYHVPPYKIGVGQMPSYNNVQALNIEYYSQCLQSLIEAIEACLDEGLGLGEDIGTEFDLEGLLRMDSVTQMAVLKEAIGAGVMAPNEARGKVSLPPVEGGESPYLQQQNFSLAALAKRDAQDDPFSSGGAPAAPAPAPAAETPSPDPSPADEQPTNSRNLVALHLYRKAGRPRNANAR